MKRILILLWGLPLLAVPPTVTLLNTPNVADQTLSHSNMLLRFSVASSYDHYHVDYNESNACNLTSGPGTGGFTQPGSDDSGTPLTNGVILGGLSAAHTYNVCVKVSNDGGTTFGGGDQLTVVMPALPAVHPAYPIPPHSFDPSYPDTGTGLTTCPTNSSTGYCIIASATCADIQTNINTALAGVSATQGYVVTTPAGVTCTPSSGPAMKFAHFANDIFSFHPSDVTTGSPGKITVPSGKFTEGQLVTYGRSTGGTDPASNSCPYGNGLVQGGKYFTHVIDATHISLFCVDMLTGDASTTQMAFTTQGTIMGAFQFVPHVATSGTCPSAFGPVACNYWKRNLKRVVVRSDALDSQLPASGTRINPATCDAGYCTTFIDPSSNAGSNSIVAAFFNAIDNDTDPQPMTGPLHLGPGLQVKFAPSAQTYANALYIPEITSDVTVDRCVFRGGEAPNWGGNSLPSFEIAGYNTGLTGDWFDGLVEIVSAGDTGSSSTLGRGPGPILLYNNHFEGAGILVHFDANSNTFFLHGDLSVIRNEFYEPTRYMHGSPDSDGNWYGNRQPLEWKSGRRVLAEGNTFNTTWNEVTQASVFIAVTSVGEGGEGEGTTDVNISYNEMMHGPGLFNVTMSTNGGNPQTIPPNRFWAHDNLAWDINSGWYAPGGGAGPPRGWIEGPLGVEDARLEHNTFVGTTGDFPTFTWLFNVRSEGFIYSNNFFYFDQNKQGFGQDGTVQAGNTCSGFVGQQLFDCMMVNSSNLKNVFGSVDSTQAQVNTAWPGLTNYAPTTPSSLTGNGWFSVPNNDYRLLSTSIYRSGGSSAASDGADIGADMTLLSRALGHVRFVSQIPQGSLVTQINFVAPDAQACPVDWDSQPIPTSGRTPTRVADSGTVAGPRSVSITTSGAGVYYFRIQCAVEQPTGQFVSR